MFIHIFICCFIERIKWIRSTLRLQSKMANVQQDDVIYQTQTNKTNDILTKSLIEISLFYE